VFSNFGVNNAYFDNRSDKVEVFLNEGGAREAPFLGYEVYQLIFDEPVML
jgi:hypothetical protein